MPIDDQPSTAEASTRSGSSSLASIGLGPAEEAAYELLVDRQQSTSRQLAAAWRRSESLPEILVALEAKGLVVRDSERPDRYTAANPRSALNALLWARSRDLEEASAYAAELVAEHGESGTGNGASALVEVVTGHRAVRQRLTQVERSCRREVCCLYSDTGFGPADVSLAVRELLEREIGVRTIYDRGSIQRPGGFPPIERSIEAGERARVAAVPTTLVAVDGRLAFLPLQRAEYPVDAAMIVHPSGLLDALLALFDELWRRAVPLSVGSSDRDTESAVRGRPAAEERLVAMLLSGLTDQAIARHLGIGHRTVQRRVSGLARDLGAHSRFQAGVQIALRRLRDEVAPSDGGAG